jgi:thioredoxin 1
MQEDSEKKSRYCSSRVLLLGVAVVVVGIACCFWPKVKGLRQAAKAAIAGNKNVSLSAIVHSDDSRLAIVNGKTVCEGDMIGGARVVKILRDTVEFEESGKRWTEHMPAAEEGVGSALPVLLQLGSHGCPPCRRMAPILDGLRTKYAKTFQISYIDVWKNRQAALEYGVRAIPTQIFYDSHGREVFRHVGFYSRRDILDTWKQLGVGH